MKAKAQTDNDTIAELVVDNTQHIYIYIYILQTQRFLSKTLFHKVLFYLPHAFSWHIGLMATADISLLF